MAYIWHGVANFTTQEVAEAFANHFDRSAFTVPHAGTVNLRLVVEHNDSGWECCICPYVFQRPAAQGSYTEANTIPPEDRWWHLNGHGGPDSPEEAEDIDACAKVIYERLGRIYNYRFAFTGVEVGDWRSAGGLLDDISPGGLYDEHRLKKFHGFDGLVISDALYEAAGFPEGFIPFGSQDSGYHWVPYTSIKKIEG